MNIFHPKYPVFLKWLYPKRIARLKDSNSIYLTFDDGPVPEATPWVLDSLREYDAKATFFCIGENVKKYPEIFQRIIEEGHKVGNHTFNHLNGWNTLASEYLENTAKSEEIMKEVSSPVDNETGKPAFDLFRPPYGKIRNSQARGLVKQGFKIVMWDVISGDYDTRFSPQKCLSNVLNNATAGSTIVFHDSKKAFPNLKEILPEILQFYSDKKYEFRSL